MRLPHLESFLAMQFSELTKPLDLCETSLAAEIASMSHT